MNKKRLPRWLSNKESACNAGGEGSIPGLGRSPGEGNAIHSKILIWRIPWTPGDWSPMDFHPEEPGGLRSMDSQRLGHDWTKHSTWLRKHAALGASGSPLGTTKGIRIKLTLYYRRQGSRTKRKQVLGDHLATGYSYNPDFSFGLLSYMSQYIPFIIQTRMSQDFWYVQPKVTDTCFPPSLPHENKSAVHLVLANREGFFWNTDENNYHGFMFQQQPIYALESGLTKIEWADLTKGNFWKWFQ